MKILNLSGKKIKNVGGQQIMSNVNYVLIQLLGII